MSGKSTFRLTFHVSHPSVSVSEVKDIFDLPVRFSQSVGEQRKTKNGKVLGGIYKNTNISFCLHDLPLSFNEISIDDLIKKQLGSYDTNYINQLIESGGNCNFLLGIFSNENAMFELNLDVINMLSAAKVSMKYDFYGGNE